MALDTAMARPRSDSTHDLNCMGGIVVPIGQYTQVPKGKFTYRVLVPHDLGVKTIDETRRAKLEMLIKRFGGKIADLNEALGYERTHSQLARIRNRNARTDRPGKFFDMGDEQAREIEQKLSLGLGWMDTPPTYAELHGEDDPRAALFKVTEDMSAQDLYTALTVLTALKTTQAGQTDRAVTEAPAPVTAPAKERVRDPMVAILEAALEDANKRLKTTQSALRGANNRITALKQTGSVKAFKGKATPDKLLQQSSGTIVGPFKKRVLGDPFFATPASHAGLAPGNPLKADPKTTSTQNAGSKH